MTKSEKIAAFDPDGPAQHHQLYGLPFTPAEADAIVIGVPWDATASYGKGTANGPAAILEASQQVELYDAVHPEGWKQGAALVELPGSWQALSEQHSTAVANANSPEQHSNALEQLNAASAELRTAVASEAHRWLDQGKLVGVLGGEHSVPLGLLDALCSRHSGIGILHLDAHFDYRNGYEGKEQSHASIMHHAAQLEGVERIVSVGIRDYCEAELDFVRAHGKQCRVFFMRDLREAQFAGTPWQKQCATIVEALPTTVYISFDVDCLEPSLCPNTGTPVPGGFQFEEVLYLVRTLLDYGKTIVGFDLCEVAPGDAALPQSLRELDGNVGARVLYQLLLVALKSQTAR